MPEEKIVPSTTILEILANIIEIFTFYNIIDELPNILAMIIGDGIGTIDDTPFIENELLAVVKNYPTEINVQINSDGELLITGDDALQYSIDGNGNLIYLKP